MPAPTRNPTAYMPRRTNLRRTLPKLRQRGLLALSRARKVSERRCAALEQKAWAFGGAHDYGWVVRRLCRADPTLEFETVVAPVAPAAPAIVSVAESTVVSDGLLECRKCHSRKIDQVEVQTRSGDEAATLFCLCTACGHRWKM